MMTETRGMLLRSRRQKGLRDYLRQLVRQRVNELRGEVIRVAESHDTIHAACAARGFADRCVQARVCGSIVCSSLLRSRDEGVHRTRTREGTAVWRIRVAREAVQ